MPADVPLAGLLDSPAWEVLCLGLGLVVGSFANVCIYRIPAEKSVVSPRSSCPRCGVPIAAADNVPVLSWLLLRARCRACQAPISARYPAVEAANGVLWLTLAAGFGPSPRVAAAMVFATALLVLALIDYDHRILPDVITLPGVALGLLASTGREVWPEWWGGGPGLAESASAALAGYLMLKGVAWLAERHYGKEALGQGDWKMVAMLGAFLGWQPMLLSILLGSLAGSLTGVTFLARALLRRMWRRRRFPEKGALRHYLRYVKLPFGTFLALGGIIALLIGGPLLEWYRRLADV